MSSQPLISVIVPVYKAEKHLKKCVDSISNQTYKNLEIILVDDGSPDKSGQICDALAKTDNRIRVFHKENGGQSSARNLGLDEMRGEYVGFVDSDDYIEPDMYELLYNHIEHNNAQISACGLQCDYPSGKISYFNDQYPSCCDVEAFNKIDALRELTIAKKITNSPCDKLFHKDIFDGIRMRVGTIFEDFEVMPYIIEKVGCFVYDPAPKYHYIMTEESSTRGKFKEDRFVEAQISRNIVDFYNTKYPQLRDYAIARHIEICLNLIWASSEDKSFKKKRNELVKEMRTKTARSALKLLSKKNKIKYVLLWVNVNLFVWVMTKYYNR